MMKYIFVPQIQVIPEWTKCYYDSSTLRKLIKICKNVHDLVNLIHKNIQIYENLVRSQKQVYLLTDLEYLSRCEFQLNEITLESNKRFYEFSQNQVQTIFYFIQLKCFSIKSKIDRIVYYGRSIKRDDQDFASLVQNAYIQVYYLKRMIEYNRAQESTIVRQYQLMLHNYESLYQKQPFSRRMDRVQAFVQKMLFKLQKVYKINKTESQSEAMNMLISYGDVNKVEKPKEFQLLGYMMGVCLIALVIVIFIMEHYDISLQNNKVYQADFPIWRGASYFVAFQWILGFVLAFLERTKINYKLILSVGGKSMPKSKRLFFDASVTTLIYLVLMGIYLLDMARVINTEFRYFGQIMWLIEIVYFLVPLPFTYYQGKLYFLRLIANFILCPFAFMKSSIQIVWIGEQLVSFSQPFSDFAYTVCKTNDINAKCEMTDVSLGIIIALLSYRIITNTKLLQQRGWILLPPFFGSLRAFSTVITAILSYVYRKQLTTTLFVIFIICAVLSTAMAVYADIRGDWGLLQENVLRKNLFFRKKYFYYICILVNILLRCNWTLNLAPFTVNSMGILPFYLIMVIAYLQLVRRGIWNVFWIQCFHLQNCDKYMATVDDSETQKIVKSKCSKQFSQIYKFESKQQIQARDKAQMELVTQNLRTREDYKSQILRFIEKYNIKLGQIQAQIQSILKLKQ